MYKVLFVCIGATCRSPMASMLFNKKIKNYNLSGVTSSFSGLSVQYDSKINPNSKQALKDYGIFRILKKPIQLSSKLIVDSDLIVCMEEDYKQAMCLTVSDKNKSKVFCTKDFCGFDIKDPFGGTAEQYKSCLRQIDVALEKIIGVLLGNGIAKYKKSKSI